MKKRSNSLRQRKPFRVYVRKTLSAILAVIPTVIIIYEAQLPSYLLTVIIPLYGLIDEAVKRINVSKLGDLGVESKKK